MQGRKTKQFFLKYAELSALNQTGVILMNGKMLSTERQMQQTEDEMQQIVAVAIKVNLADLSSPCKPSPTKREAELLR